MDKHLTPYLNVTDEEKRKAAYIGLGRAIAFKVIKNNKDNVAAFAALTNLGEQIILDRQNASYYLNCALSHARNPLPVPSSSCECAFDVFGITEYYSPNDIAIIAKYANIVSTVMSLALSIEV